jgi:hypothetical protein
MFHNGNIERHTQLLEKFVAVEAQLEILEKGLVHISALLLQYFERMEQLMPDRGALDTAIAELGAQTSKLATLAQGSIAKGQAASPATDYSSEIAEIKQIQQNIANAIGSVNLAAGTPDVPQTPTTQPSSEQAAAEPSAQA